METFGGFKHGGHFSFGEVRGEVVHGLTKAPWLGIEFDGRTFPLADVRIDLPVAPSKVIARLTVGFSLYVPSAT